mmetsp:Transcript_2295/g.5010  ORF Transcript_2295/g.5010 Transcript_2295/m.5010 type:complete len:90 (-) Transcript_2295:1730-1999(-)
MPAMMCNEIAYIYQISCRIVPIERTVEMAGCASESTTARSSAERVVEDGSTSSLLSQSQQPWQLPTTYTMWRQSSVTETTLTVAAMSSL